MRKRSPLNQFKRILVPPDELAYANPYPGDHRERIFPEMISFGEEIDPLGTQVDMDRSIRKIKCKLYNTLNRYLYNLVKYYYKQHYLPTINTCDSYLQMGHTKLTGGMYLLMFEELTMQYLESERKLFAWLQYGCFLDLREMFIVEDISG